MPKTVLFTGYAPVHFLCYLPIYQQLRADPELELWLSGGFRRLEGDVASFNLEGFYDPFPVDRARVIPIEVARERDYDVLVCADLSDALQPRSAKTTVQIFHGVSFKNLAVRDKALRFQFLCLPGRYHGELYQRERLVREDGSTCLLTGFPKCDPLVDRRVKRAALLDRLRLDAGKPTLLFAPTGDKDNALELMGKEVISALSATGQWNVLIKPHDHPKRDVNWFKELAPLENERVRLVRDLDVIPYLASADLLLTDASSVAVEYTLVDRPIVFLDTPQLFERVRQRAPNMDLDTYGRRIGRVVERPEEVVAAVQAALADPDAERPVRQQMASHVFWKPGRAAERVAGVIRYAAGVDPSLPEDVERLRPTAPKPEAAKAPEEDPRHRFSQAAQYYDAYRSSYPRELVDWLVKVTGISPPATVADVGCGTGISTRLFAERGFAMVGVEPNDAMRAHAYGEGIRYQRGEAAATALEDGSVEMIISAQAFHWFDLDPTLAEWRRVLKPAGWCSAFWNKKEASALKDDFDRLRIKYARTDGEVVRRAKKSKRKIIEALERSPSVANLRTQQFRHVHTLDREAFFGRVLTGSYFSHEEVAQTPAFREDFDRLFDRHQEGGVVRIPLCALVVAWQLRS